MTRAAYVALLGVAACGSGAAPSLLADSGEPADVVTDGVSDDAEPRDAAAADIGDPDGSPGVDAPAPDVAEADAPEICVDDWLGDTSEASPRAVRDGDGFEGLSTCGSSDWFSVAADAGDRVVASLQADAPVVVRVDVGTDRAPDVFGPARTIDAAVAAAGEVRVEVDGDGGAVAYDIAFSAAPVDPCLATGEEPNDSASTATEFALGTTYDAAICDGDDDWYAFTIPVGGTLDVSLTFDHAVGDIDTVLYDAADLSRELTRADSGDDDERIAFGPVVEATEVRLHVYGWEGATNTYGITASIDVDPGLVRGEVSGRVTYEDRPFTASGFTGETPALPYRGGEVVVLREDDDRVVATAYTDAAGDYAVAWMGDADASYRVEARSVVEVDGFRTEVRDRTRSGALYTVASSPFAPGVVSRDLIGKAEVPAGGAFNIADVTGDGFRFAARYSDERSPTLVYRWQQGQAFSCGSCYSRNTISLGGATDDPDEYDDDIILHEFAHYWVAHFSADSSSGGAHRDRLVSPGLAYGEGLAYFLSSAIRADATMVDNFLGDVRYIDYERVEIGGDDLDTFYGTSTGTPSGSMREEIPAAILWDLWDAGAAEVTDAAEMGDALIALLQAEFSDGASVDVGARGIDIADVALLAHCAGVEGVQAILDERAFPYTVADDADACPSR